MPNAKETVARLRGTVRVSLPAKIAYNPESLKKTIGALLEDLGCRTCFSGADCVFTAERNFVVNEEGIFSHHSISALNPQPLPPAPELLVSLPATNQLDINKVYSAIDIVASRIGGCLPCHSGFDVSYLSEVEFIGIDPDGEVQQYGAAAQQ
jgi:hypothetical protein